MEPTPHKPESFRSSKAFITFTVAYAVFTDSFLYGAIVPMAPFALQRQGFEDGEVQKLITLMLAPWGWLSDRYPQRRVPFLFGLIVLLVATAVLWFAPFVLQRAILGLEISGRGLQGFASAIVWTTALAVLVDTVGQEELGEYAGYIGLALNLGNVAGPVLGGVDHEYGGVHGVFGLCMAVIGVDVVLRLIMKERQRKPFAVTMPNPSPDSGSESNKEATIELASPPTFSTSSALETSSLVRHSVSKRTRIPVIFRLLGSARFCVSLWGVFVLAVVFTVFDTVLPITVERILGWDATGAGLIFLPFSLPSLFGMLIGRRTDRRGGRWVVFASFLVACPCLIALRFVREKSAADIALLVVLLLLIGTCVTVILEPLFSEVGRRSKELQEMDARAGHDVRHGYHAQAYAHFNMAWSLGNTVGPIMAGYINDAAGWGGVTLALGILCGFSAVPLVLFCDGWLLSQWCLRRQGRQSE
ncbi:hypothetical protein M409DRAFT_62206 [Zasmidium cellare ATCC 36951]|uniref:Major facilitator superfamily (MFS) profile domain-containing protein n=1 Tax=Zasmidium cellare ATCC 36951 TaxID=1080233 RepID=A0A6A6D6G9_ZASCE|nr:uncharacterized protein M409DRAFT_62206 [Zasmidium cellare ATCC 36951]KAF2174028.1 hypothetical protein M409DRAFT_62206 [Zasmidium cellare ATCC 36951]